MTGHQVKVGMLIQFQGINRQFSDFRGTWEVAQVGKDHFYVKVPESAVWVDWPIRNYEYKGAGYFGSGSLWDNIVEVNGK